MSIRDYNKHYVVLNGLTNEQIKVPKTNKMISVMSDFTIDDLILFDIVREELQEADSVTILKTYMKD